MSFDTSYHLSTITSGFRLTPKSPAAVGVRKVPVFGIIGGVGSGKSSVVKEVSGFHLHVIDADQIGHRQLSEEGIRTQLRQVFGDQIFTPEGTVDRSQLAARVFGPTSEHSSALRQLNQVLHPAIHREIHTQINNAPQDADAIILDAALLLEAGWNAECHWLIFIDTPEKLRQERVLKNRGWEPDELQRREATQLTLDEKRNRADFVIDNSTTITAAAAQMTNVFQSTLKTR